MTKSLEGLYNNAQEQEKEKAEVFKIQAQNEMEIEALRIKSNTENIISQNKEMELGRLELMAQTRKSVAKAKGVYWKALLDVGIPEVTANEMILKFQPDA